MKLSPKQITLAVLAILVLALGTWAYLLYAGPQRAVSRYKQKLRAQGERLTVTELLPAPRLSEGNSASLFHELILFRPTLRQGLLETNGPPAMFMLAPGHALIGSQQPALLESGTNTWEEMASWLEQNVDPPEALQQLIEHPVLDFQLDYRQGFSLLLPHLAPLKIATQRLSVAALSDLHRGDIPSATLHIRAMLAIVKGMRDERLVISQLVRFAIAHMCIAATWELLQSPGLSDDQLALLQREWQDLQFVLSTEAALAMERAMADKMCEEMRSSSSKFRNTLAISGGPAVPASGDWLNRIGTLTIVQARETLWRVGWSYPDQLRALQGHQVLLEALRTVQAGRDFKTALEREQAQLSALGIFLIKDNPEGFPLLFDQNGVDLRTLFTRSVQSLHRVTNRLLVMEVARQLTMGGLALKRYALKYHSYPPTLTALVPEFIRSLPLDPVDRQPLRYRLNPDGKFTLYSIGEDGQDNGGDPAQPAESKSLHWYTGQDWLWPAPATPEEIKAHFDKLMAKRKRPN